MEIKELRIAAIKGSIEHWERLRDGTLTAGEGPYGDDCALCEFSEKQSASDDSEDSAENTCFYCPLSQFTSTYRGCMYNEKIPWTQAEKAWLRSRIEKTPEAIQAFSEAAGKMVSFLKEVLVWAERP